MDNKTEYKFSWTVKPSEGDFRTARGDTVEDVMKGMDELEQRISLRGKPLATQPGEKLEASMCPIHRVEMQERTNKKNNAKFYSHYIGEYPSGSWCSGK